LSSNVPRAFDMDGLERLITSFDIQADSVDNRVGTGQGKGRGRFVPNIGVDGLELSAVSETPGEGCALGVADGDADPCSLVDETFDDVAAQKSGPAENRDKLVSHMLLDPTLRTRISARHEQSRKSIIRARTPGRHFSVATNNSNRSNARSIPRQPTIRVSGSRADSSFRSGQ
jgi:hypothetical protein